MRPVLIALDRLANRDGRDAATAPETDREVASERVELHKVYPTPRS